MSDKTETYCIVETGELVVGRSEALDAAVKSQPSMAAVMNDGESGYIKRLCRAFLEGPPPPYGYVAATGFSFIRVKVGK